VNNDASSSSDRIAQATAGTVARAILAGIEELIIEAQAKTRPLEVDPFRTRLFEYFVTADQSGLIPDEREIGAFQNADDDEEADLLNLSADSLCRQLARRWGLDMAAREAQALQTRLAGDQLERMRLLWSVMRMWMEWSYAWHRGSECHATENGKVAKLE